MISPGQQMWAKFVKTYVTTLYAGTLAVIAFIIAVDPYDGGRFGIEWPWGIPAAGPPYANASRGRDQRFDSVVLGNSHGQLLDPSRLSAGSGRQFVQLTVHGAGPREQLAMLDWFHRHHARIGAIVLAADTYWCTQDAALPPVPVAVPFPFWLYGRSNLEYLAHVLRTQAVGFGWRRLLIAAGLLGPEDRVGYIDYELGRRWRFSPEMPQALDPANLEPRPPQRRFPAIERLKEFLPRLPSDMPLVIVYPPVFVTELPSVGSPDAQILAECKGALADLAASRGAFIDFAVDGDIARDPRNFMDRTHYRANVARQIEARILDALTRFHRP